MAIKTLNSGIYPAGLTPFDKSGKVDVGGLRALTQWYAERGCAGVFATCLSNEIFNNFGDVDNDPYMSLEDRLLVSREMVKAAPDNFDVVTSGHVFMPTPSGLEQLKAMADTGAKALVLVANRLADKWEDEDAVRRNLYAIMEAIPDMDLGLYECPYPYNRQLSPALLKEMAETGRFVFMKETSCNPTIIKEKVAAVKGTRFKYFNANSVSLLDSVLAGGSGLCGILPNFHPELYVKLMELAETDVEKARELQEDLSTIATLNFGVYPTSAKAYLQLEGLKFAGVGTRLNPENELDEINTMEMEHRYAMTQRLREKWL